MSELAKELDENPEKFTPWLKPALNLVSKYLL
jgi:hypothetical protein